eukprot:GHVU01003859.1.p1 GENE.GHVU01003859.1~~GHVU01003859.1.p1  ORF type:complete len:379 (+),score=80.53 GHVU01003859.1:83-1138(+)
MYDPEDSHNLSIWAAQNGLVPYDNCKDHELLATTVLGREFSNPLGLAAGCDKQGEAAKQFMMMGFGFVEVGSVTPKPQPGNDKPRVFRLDEDQGIINRYGFNSDGADVVLDRMEKLRSEGELPGVLMVNLGKNKTADAIPDYTYGVKKFKDVADMMVVNVSSPNTPGLRNLQSKKELSALMSAVVKARNTECPKTPILVKIAPDLSDAELKDVCNVVMSNKVDGMVVSNTTNQRPDSLQSANKGETGGLSGEPVKDISTAMIKKVYALTKGQVTIIGVGGVATGQDAYDKIKAGASLVEMYSRLSMEGPWAPPKIKIELRRLLQEDEYESLAEAVGADHRPPKKKAEKKDD